MWLMFHGVTSVRSDLYKYQNSTPIVRNKIFFLIIYCLEIHVYGCLRERDFVGKLEK